MSFELKTPVDWRLITDEGTVSLPACQTKPVPAMDTGFTFCGKKILIETTDGRVLDRFRNFVEMDQPYLRLGLSNDD